MNHFARSDEERDRIYAALHINICCSPHPLIIVLFVLFPHLVIKLPFLHTPSFDIPNNFIAKHRGSIQTTTIPEGMAVADSPIYFSILLLVKLSPTVN